jgi:hypothetical protein
VKFNGESELRTLGRARVDGVPAKSKETRNGEVGRSACSSVSNLTGISVGNRQRSPYRLLDGSVLE